jgi:phosphotransferase system enzyme I (PtsI)
MEIRKGIAVSPGYRQGPAFLLDSEEAVILRRHIRDDEVASEVDRLAAAIAASFSELEAIKQKTSKEIGAEVALIFDFQLKMLQDENLQGEIRRFISKEKLSAEYAVSRTVRRYINMFKSSGNTLLRERTQDVIDFKNRLLRNLRGGGGEDFGELTSDVIIVARDLTPSQTTQLNRKHVKGIATDGGGRTSHAAIVAKALGIPAVVGLEDVTSRISGGDTIVIDGVNGLVILSPTAQTEEKYREYAVNYDNIEAALRGESSRLACETMDGYRIKILANIEFPEEIDVALSYGCEGVGLYRTEFLYSSGDGDPSEERQFDVYKKAAEKLGDKPLVLRTWDLGADKFHSESVGTVESNPFLGCRSIRFSFLRVDLFKKQLRAILRASVFGNIKIMLPMVSAIEEIRKAKVILRETMEELDGKRIPFDRDIKVGIMVEVPSAAITSDFMAEEAAFFSIGTNDLVQYALAVDRINERVAGLYQPAHPAISRLLLTVIGNAKKNGIPVAICGEMSADPLYVLPLLGFGLREFSVTPSSIPEIKKVIRSVTMKKASEVKDRLLTLKEAKEAEIFLREQIRPILPQKFGG